MTDCSCRSHGTFLTAKGLEETAPRERSLEGLDAMGESLYLDKVVSVSELGRDGTHWPPDAFIDEQHRRFHNGCSEESRSEGPGSEVRTEGF